MNCPECGKKMEVNLGDCPDAIPHIHCPKGCTGGTCYFEDLVEIIDKLQAEIDIRDEGIAPPDADHLKALLDARQKGE